MIDLTHHQWVMESLERWSEIARYIVALEQEVGRLERLHELDQRRLRRYGAKVRRLNNRVSELHEAHSRGGVR